MKDGEMKPLSQSEIEAALAWKFTIYKARVPTPPVVDAVSEAEAEAEAEDEGNNIALEDLLNDMIQGEDAENLSGEEALDEDEENEGDQLDEEED